uniref:MICAL-like protein 1 n=1 Tax=Scophthalmus maximus TaxID=52904 RepID=A0A8D3BKS2_SCOMX
MGSLKALQEWCRIQCEGYGDVAVRDMSSSFRDGLAFCALIHRYRPELIDFGSLSKENVYENNRLAFEVAETQLGIPALLDPEDMVSMKVPDRLSIITYVSQYYNFFNNKSQGWCQRPSAARSSSTCAACQKHVHLVQRFLVDGKLYHRICFRCTECHSTLLPGSYKLGSDSGALVCTHHLARQALANQNGRPDLSKRPVVVQTARTGRSTTPHTSPSERGRAKTPSPAGRRNSTDTLSLNLVSACTVIVCSSMHLFGFCCCCLPSCDPPIPICVSSLSSLSSVTHKPKDPPWLALVQSESKKKKAPPRPPAGLATPPNAGSLSSLKGDDSRPSTPPPPANPFEDDDDENNEAADATGADTPPSGGSSSQHAFTKSVSEPSICSPCDSAALPSASSNEHLLHPPPSPYCSAMPSNASSAPATPQASRSSVTKGAGAPPPRPQTTPSPLASGATPSHNKVTGPPPNKAIQSKNRICKENPFNRKASPLPAKSKTRPPKGPRPARPPAPGHGFPLIKRKVQSDQFIPVEDIHGEMGQLEKQLDELEQRGVELEKKLRDTPNDEDEERLLVDWFTLIHEKHLLVRREAELVYTAKQQNLEERQADVEYELRCLLNKPEKDWTEEDKSREQELMAELVTIIEQRNQIVNNMDQDRQREEEEDKVMEAMLKKKDFHKDPDSDQHKKKGTKFKPIKVLKRLSHKGEPGNSPRKEKS